jgi:hypothetical protein
MRNFNLLINHLLKHSLLLLLCGLLFTPLAFAEEMAAHSESRLSDTVIPIATDIPERPAPLLELGDDFLSNGPISAGFELPTGAVWQPSLIVWGTYRTAVQTVDLSNDRITEWSNRFDFFSNLYLTATERILFGARPLDSSGRFTRYTFESPDEAEEGEFEDEFNFDVETLFFEGDFGELFPFLDGQDKRGLDFGIAAGRQPINFQDGMLINDSLDAVGISAINLKPRWAVNHRATVLWGWGELNRTNLAFDDTRSQLFGLFQEVDWRASTVELDFTYVDGDEVTGDGFYGGIAATQRLLGLNSTLRVVGSLADGEQTEHNSRGLLTLIELSQSPHHTDNHLYMNAFWGLENFRSASRGPTVGSPLAPAGVLFASVGLGNYGAALGGQSDDCYGGALGYQLFFDRARAQLIVELGGRYGYEEVGQRAVAGGFSLQKALGRRTVLRLDGFSLYGRQRLNVGDDSDNDTGYGGRLEWQLRL